MQNLFTIDLVQLRTLRELRERGTITATAAALHLTPSAVSQQIAALSRSVGAPLLTRHGRRVRLTPQAGIVLDHADHLHTELEAIKAELARFGDGQAGAVRLVAFGTAITGLVVPALRPRPLRTSPRYSPHSALSLPYSCSGGQRPGHRADTMRARTAGS